MSPIPAFTQLAAELETPLSAYLKLGDTKYSFFLESAEATVKGGAGASALARTIKD